jgi:NAD(P)-dependent dehydrogenase (short-subunit alcohol dehydrogenase family)
MMFGLVVGTYPVGSVNRFPVNADGVMSQISSTGMLERFLEGRQEARAGIAALSPLERIGTPDDIAEVVAFLAGPARWINGQVLYANGGAI